MPTLPTKNPFEGLFDKQGTEQEKKKETLVRTNPFEGLFEVKKPVETKVRKKPAEELDRFGLPKATISAAPKKEPKKETLLTKVAKAVLPRSLEVKFGLTEPDIAETMMEQESARQSYEREKKFQTVLKKEGVSEKEIAPLPEGYKEPDTFWGSVVEGVKFGYQATIKPAIGYLVESIGQEIGNPGWTEWGQQFGDKQVAYLLKHPELFPAEDIKGAFEGGLKDPRYWGRKIGEAIPFTATVLGATAAAGLTRNPALVIGTAYGMSFAIEKANAYKDMLDQGIAPDKATLASTVYGSIASAIENMFGFKPAEIVMGKTGINLVKSSFKSFLKEELPKYSLTLLGNVMVEGGEEGAQQFSQNLITKWLDGTQGLWEGVAESIPAGSIGALPFGGSQVISDIIRSAAERKGKTTPQAQVEVKPIETAKEPEIGEIIKQNISFYQSTGGYSAGTEVQNAGLRDLETILKTPAGKEAATKIINEALSSKQIEPDESGQITIYRTGEPSAFNNLASFTYDKKIADIFKQDAAASGKELNVYEIKVKPSDISLFIGGAESEVLLPKTIIESQLKVKPAAIKTEDISGVRDQYAELSTAIDLAEGDQRQTFIDQSNILLEKLNEYTAAYGDTIIEVRDKGKETAKVRAVKFSDGKWGVSISANTGISGVMLPFGFRSVDLFNTKQEAVANGAEQILNWAKAELTQSNTATDKALLGRIINRLDDYSKSPEKSEAEREIETVEYEGKKIPVIGTIDSATGKITYDKGTQREQVAEAIKEKPKEVEKPVAVEAKVVGIDKIIEDYKAALEDEYVLSDKEYKREKRSGAIIYGEKAGDVKQRISNLNRQFANEFYKEYKAMFGEYPIGFISLNDSWLEWKNNPGAFAIADFGQAETEAYDYRFFLSVDELLEAAEALKNRGRSSEIIQSDIQYEVEGTRPAGKEEVKPPEAEKRKETTLPRELAGAKPRYGYGTKLFTLSFESDIDKALYIVAQEKRSKADNEYMDFLRGILTDISDEQIRTQGLTVRAAIKELAREAEPGNLIIEKVRQKEEAPAKTKTEFNVGDVFDTQGHTNMISPVRIREITGNTLKFTDAKGIDYAGIARATVRNLVKEGSWKRITTQPRFAKKELTDEELVKQEIEILELGERAEKEPSFASVKAVKIAEKPVEAVKKIIPTRRSALPILNEFMVKDGKIHATDLEAFLTLNTGLKEGMYKLIGKEAVPSTTNPGDFPVKPEIKVTPIFKAEIENQLQPAIKNASKLVNNNSSKAELGGVFVNVLPNKVEIAATDAMSLYRKTILAEISGEGKFIVREPSKIANILKYLGAISEVGIDKKNGYAKFSGDMGELMVRTVDGDFPTFYQIYPELKEQYSFSREAMLAALKQIKPFVNRISEVNVKFSDNKLTLFAENEDKSASKTLSVPATLNTVAIKSQSPNNGVLVTPLSIETATDISFNVDFLINALSMIEGDQTYLYSRKLGKGEGAPILLSDEKDLFSAGRGNDYFITKETALFHGTTANNAASIISDGMYRTEDETATYGKAVYLTPNYQTAKDYANENGDGEVIIIKSLRDLKLYEPTTKERETLVDLMGEKQEEAIKKILGDVYDGFYIPDDGRGDGGEQVIIYEEYLLGKAVLASEPKKGKNKIAPAGIASMGGAKLGEFEAVAENIRKQGRRFTKEEIEQQIKENEEMKRLWDKMSEVDKNRLFNLMTFPSTVDRAPSGIASAGADKLGNFEDIAGLQKPTKSQLKIYEKVKELIKKYAKTIGEGYLPRNALGVYYPDTANVRIKGMNNLSVAAHEITHFLDFAYGISKQLMGIKGYSISGNPIYESETYKIRKEMTALYARYYPGAKPDHPLSKRMLEGFATLLEKYLEQPSTINTTYPNLVKEFLTEGGRYYKSVMGEILADLRDIVSEYQGLEALDKIGARVISDKVNVNKDTFLNFAEKVKTEIADNVYPIEKLAKEAGIQLTKSDPSLWVRQYNASNAIILNNINGSRGYWGWRNGELVKLHPYNFKDLIDELIREQMADEFGFYLVARREHFLYQELKSLKEKGEKIEGEEMMIEGGKVKPVGENRASQIERILANDGFTETEVNEAYLQNKNRFSDFEVMYDQLVKEDLNFLYDPSVQLITDDQYKQLDNKEGYASFKRYFYDEVVGEEAKQIKRARFGTAKVSSMLKRLGSQKPIINPLFSALTNHAEITRKGLKQIVYNRIAGVARNFPELFQVLQLKGIPDRQGHILFPQEKDPQIIMARQNYKRVPILADSIVKRTIDEVLNYQNLHFFEKLLMGASRFFTKGTTGLFPGFALTNYAVDQVAATAQTREKYFPIYDPLTKLTKALRPGNPQHAYLQEYLVLGGERQTIVGWQDLTPNELFEKIANERKGLLKVIDAVNAGMDLLATPSKWSEMMTRATEYIKARQEGKPAIVALEEAGRVTAPFHHIGRLGGGRLGQTIIKSIPFFNPGIQVLAQAVETLETKGGRQRYGFVALAITASSIASLGLIMAFGSDDQKKLYVDIHPDELNKYIWLPSPDRKTLIKIRVPDQMTVVATLVNMLWADKALQANYTAGEYFSAGVSWLPQQLDPSQPARALMSWIPQIIKPGVLTLVGVKDFPKIMPLESQTQQNKPPGLRTTEGTSQVAKWLGKTFNLSPIKIDYLLEGYVGRVARFFTGKPGVYNPFKAMSREYYFTSGRKIQQYYEAKEKNDQDYYSYKHDLKDFKLGERSAILKERGKLDKIGDAIDDYKDVDDEKNPEKAVKIRNKILKLIDETL